MSTPADRRRAQAARNQANCKTIWGVASTYTLRVNCDNDCNFIGIVHKDFGSKDEVTMVITKVHRDHDVAWRALVRELSRVAAECDAAERELSVLRRDLNVTEI